MKQQTHIQKPTKTLQSGIQNSRPNPSARTMPGQHLTATTALESRFDHDFSKIPMQFPAGQKQPTSPSRTPNPGYIHSQSALSRTKTIVGHHPLHATIRRTHPPSLGLARADAPIGSEPDDQQFSTLFEQLAAIPEGSLSAAAPRSTANTDALSGPAAAVQITLPDIEIPALAVIDRNDAVNAAFTYSGSIARGGAAPSGFGVTRSFNSRLSGIAITQSAGVFDVAATFEHPITYQVRSGAGPDGQIDIASATDSDITSANYTTVVSDLTPDTSDLNGRPPRTAFWAEDLTLRHERVHADDDMANGPGAVTTVTTWLNGQTAASVADVNTLLGALPGRFANALLAALSTEDGERHAYGDGAALYRARANAVKTRGDSGSYASGTSPGLSRGAITAIGIGGGALAGAGIGALAGGPVGAAIGAGIGALVGGLGSLLF